MPTFTPDDNAAFQQVLDTASYVDSDVDEDAVPDPDLTLEDVIERARGILPTDPAFPGILDDAKSVVQNLLDLDPENEDLQDTLNLLDRLGIIDWETEPIFASGAPEHDNSVCIMAIPAADSAVHDIGPEDKHATLYYFGDIDKHSEPERMEASKDWMRQVLAAVADKVPPFEAEVTEVGELGDSVVWLLDSPNLQDLFAGIKAADSEIAALYDGADAERYPEYTPHVTIGRGPMPDEQTDEEHDDPATVSDDNLDEATHVVTSIPFDRLSLWWGNEHIDFPLTGDPDTSEFEALFSLVASGFKEDQIRVPRGNGEFSGRWMETPGAMFEQMDIYLGEEPPMGDRAALYFDMARAAALELDTDMRGDEITDKIFEVKDNLESAKASTTVPGVKDILENAIQQTERLASFDWTLVKEDNDIGAGDKFLPGVDWPEPRPVEVVDAPADGPDWDNLDTEDIIAFTSKAIEDFFDLDDRGDGDDTPEGKAAQEAVARGLQARAQAVIDSVGLPIHVERAKWYHDGQNLFCEYTFVDDDGDEVGKLERHFYAAGEQVTNDYFAVDPRFQNQGLGIRMTHNLEQWYADNGVTSVAVHANIDVGGYTWARAGFDLSEDQYDPGTFLQRMYYGLAYIIDGTGSAPAGFQDLYTKMVNHRTQNEEMYIEDAEIERWVTEIKALGGDIPDFEDYLKEVGEEDEYTYAKEPIEIAEDVYDRYWQAMAKARTMSDEEVALRELLMEWADNESEDPTMYDVSTFGQGTYLERADTQQIWHKDGLRVEKTQEIRTWPGKQVLLGTDWQGVKYIYPGENVARVPGYSPEPKGQ